MNIFRRSPVDPTEAALRHLSKALRWARPALVDAPEPVDQLGHLARRLCEGIDRDQPAETVAALRLIEELLASETRPATTDAPAGPGAPAAAGATFDPEHSSELDQRLTLSLIEDLSNWCSWPETPQQAVAAVEGSLGPLVGARWAWIRRQAIEVDRWLDEAGTRSERGAKPAEIRKVSNADLRFRMRSNYHYLDDTKAVGLADRLRFEKSGGA